MNYRSLDWLTDRVASRLHEHGVGSGSLVGLLAPRSITAIIVMLSALKVGAAYLPLDPSYPSGANVRMLADSKPVVVLGVPDLISELKLPVGVVALDIEAFVREARSAGPFTPSDLQLSPDTPAYVMYTSGSTGTPKGVVVPHRGIVRLVRGQDFMTLGPDEVLLHAAPLAFDASTLEIWGALLNGGRVVIVEDAVPSLDVIANTIRNHGVTAVWLTAGLFHLFAERDLSAFAGVRQLLAGGDVLSPSHVRRVLDALPQCRLINGYGPTENTTFTCCFSIPRSGWGDGSVPIGMPISGTKAYIVDDALELVADGEIGQLVAGGDGVALGYLNRPDLTAEHFVPDHFSRKYGALLYLTGDYARRRSDGAIEFLGRRDRQIKISGKRIELDEIENQLRSIAGIQDAVVIARSVSDAPPRLGAYLKPAQWPTAKDFSDKILVVAKTRLPQHMVPADVLVLETLPLNANGKVDRSALPTFPSNSCVVQTASTARTISPTVTLIVDAWRKVLGPMDIPLTKNFFDLGGTSIGMVKVHAELSGRVAMALTMTDLFSYPTIANLAAFIDGPVSKDGTLPTDSNVSRARARGAQQRALLQARRGLGGTAGS
ncbi:MAG: non-ribosomal peptide synthetase [Hyphomicrobiaceae bacterium]|nr:non-ribosomal peptide synthetase [Hyphomicrobiaceae bacterium]